MFDAHRTSACLALGQPERVIPALLASEKDFPEDYNPPQRLALAYGAMKRYDEALAASDRAMARALRAAQARRLPHARRSAREEWATSESARKTLQEMLAYAEALPAEQRSDRAIAAIKKQLEEAKN